MIGMGGRRERRKGGKEGRSPSIRRVGIGRACEETSKSGFGGWGCTKQHILSV